MFFVIVRMIFRNRHAPAEPAAETAA
jgi:hypothetical protein